MMCLLNSEFILNLDCLIIVGLFLLSVVLAVWQSSNESLPGGNSSGNTSEPGNNNNKWKLLLFLFAISLGVTGGILFERYGESLIPGSDGYLPPSVAIFGGALAHFLIFISQAIHETLFIDFTRLLTCGFFQESSLVFIRSIVELEIPGVENLNDFFKKLCDSNLMEISFCGDRLLVSDLYKNEMSYLAREVDTFGWVYFKLIASFENVSYKPLEEGFYFFFNVYCSEHGLVFTGEEKEFYFYLFIKAVGDRNTLLVFLEL